ncbi:MAG TPA: NAD-dependent epimerase/dehydratase family protein [Gaiellaceae bacterium]|nr:NAD-dependent epimerase/dehydratase family protein [Gaiellaceae bacterium]
MRVLVLGGTLFVGRHLVEASLERGHEVTLFNRGQTDPGLYPELETRHGDRAAGDLESLREGTWDAVFDTSARVPRWVREAAALLADRVGHYSFVSSCSVYADTTLPGTNESSPVHVLEDETTEEITSADVYGGLKVLCERELGRALPGRSLAARAGLIVGPYDSSGRFTYWVHRIARGGDVLAPEPRDQPVQLIHGRDLADWLLDMAEKGDSGVYNATGPESPLTMERVLEAIVAETGSEARLIWADEDYLVENGVEAWSDLPLWVAPGGNPEVANFLAVDVTKAVTTGLKFRPLARTIRDTLDQAETFPQAGLDETRERELLTR